MRAGCGLERHKMVILYENRKYIIRCACGFQTAPWFTAQAAGYEFDQHLARCFPNGSERDPCPSLDPSQK